MRKEIYVLIGLVAIFSLAFVSTAKAAPLTSVTVTPSNTFGTQVANYTIGFTTASSTEINSKILLVFPSGFNITNAATTTTLTGLDGIISTLSTSASGTTQLITLTRADGAIIVGSTAVTLGVNSIVNPTTGGSLTIDVETQTAASEAIDSAPSTAFTIITCCQVSSFYSDTTPPTSKITSPTDGLSISAGKKYVIEGIGTDTGGSPPSTVERVEVSLDGGQSWSIAQSSAAGGSFSWQYIWGNPTAGEYVIKVRATDTAGNIESPSAGVKVTVSAAVPEVPAEALEEVAEKPITEMTVQELEAKITEVQQKIIDVLRQLIQLFQQQIQALLAK